MYFDGRLNFEAIVKMLIAEHGTGDAVNVLLTGKSAGGIGTYHNVDWLSEQLPHANVKAVSEAGWFYPRSIDDKDSSDYKSPSDWSHYTAGLRGNRMIKKLNTVSYPLWQVDPNPACVLNEKDNPELCNTLDGVYKYIRSPIFAVQSQFDQYHLFNAFKAPIQPSDDELETLEQYIKMYGEATRQSLQQILDRKSLFQKPHTDGLFSPSCISHGNSPHILVDDMDFVTLSHDWFFQINRYESQHKLVEKCPGKGSTLPCNAEPKCRFGTSEIKAKINPLQVSSSPEEAFNLTLVAPSLAEIKKDPTYSNSTEQPPPLLEEETNGTSFNCSVLHLKFPLAKEHTDIVSISLTVVGIIIVVTLIFFECKRIDERMKRAKSQEDGVFSEESFNLEGKGLS